MTIDKESFSKAYFAYFRTNDKQYFWAWETLADLMGTDPEQVWVIIQYLVGQTSEPAPLGYIGAGPLEDLLVLHGEQFIERVEAGRYRAFGKTRFPRRFGNVS